MASSRAVDPEPHFYFSLPDLDLHSICLSVFRRGKYEGGKTQKCQEIVSNSIFLKLSKLGPTPLFFAFSFEQSFFCLFELGNLFQFF